jgi:hypothetical protein
VEWAERELRVKRKRRADADEGGARRFRCHLIKYMSGLRGVVEMKRGLNEIRSSADVMRAVDAVLEQNV